MTELPFDVCKCGGKECKKQEHFGGGYLHEYDDDAPYDVDGLSYCGRCHSWLGKTRRFI
jgi:hypothetical protein